MGTMSLIAGSIIAVSAFLVMPSVVNSFGRTGRGIASNTELSRLNGDISKILNTRALCKHSRLIGVRFLDLAQPSLSPVVLTELTGNPVAYEGWRGPNGRAIDQLRFVDLAPIGPAVLGTLYRATLSMQTSVNAGAITQRNPNHLFSTKVVLDDTHTIVDCGSDSSIVAACSGHERVRGINPDGTVLCGSANLPDFDSGWIPVTAVYPAAVSGCPCFTNPPIDTLACPLATRGQMPCFITHGLNRPYLDYSVQLEWMDSSGNVVSSVRRMDLTYNGAPTPQVTSVSLFNTGFNAKDATTVTVAATGAVVPAPVPSPTPMPWAIPAVVPPTHVRLRLYADD